MQDENTRTHILSPGCSQTRNHIIDITAQLAASTYLCVPALNDHRSEPKAKHASNWQKLPSMSHYACFHKQSPCQEGIFLYPVMLWDHFYECERASLQTDELSRVIDKEAWVKSAVGGREWISGKERTTTLNQSIKREEEDCMLETMKTR